MNNVLTDAIPAKWRKRVYAAAFVVGLGLTAWQASDGDWGQAASAFVGSLVPALAASNTPTYSPDVFNAGH